MSSGDRNKDIVNGPLCGIGRVRRGGGFLDVEF